jgi:serine/threonine-protein kinase
MSLTRDYQTGESIPGTVYQVVREIGAGGMGTVYDVEDTTIGKRYVLKTLHPELGERRDLARRMQNEARTLAQLNHPNIVEVVTAGVTADDMKLPFFVMERLNGQNLRVVLQKKGQLELPHAFHIAIDLLDALDHAHDKGVIHRDVKPDNIFLHKTVAGVTVTKLLDFGIMTLLDGGQGETGGRFLGTLRYAAPEQLRGEKPTPKMDIYAAALVLYEMIAGRGPFDHAGDPHKAAAARLHEAPPPLGTFAKVPPDVESLMRSALSIDPSARPSDAFAFSSSLRNLKRALGSVQANDFASTENRPTVNAILSPAAAELPRPAVVKPAPDVAVASRSPLANAPSPGAAPQPPELADASGGARAKPTLFGMGRPAITGAPPPSFTPPAAGSAAVERSTPPRGLAGDTMRLAAHNADIVPPALAPPPSQAPPPFPVAATLRVPSYSPPGYAAGLPERAVPAGAPSPTPVPPQFTWPRESKTDRSDAAQAHSMNPTAGTSVSRKLPGVFAVAALLAAGLIASGVYVVRHFGTRASAPSSSAPSAAVNTVSSALPTPETGSPPVEVAAPAAADASTGNPTNKSAASAPSISAPSAAVARAPVPPAALATPVVRPTAAAAPSPEPWAATPAPPPADKSIKVKSGF